MRAQRVGADTRFEALVAMMRGAMSQRPAAARVADRWAAPFLWGVMVLAAAAVWCVLDPGRAVAVVVAVAVLIVTCPCALALAAPATLVADSQGLARRGVLLQRLDALEPLARAQHIFQDKTGTLTEDRMQLRQMVLTPQAGTTGGVVWAAAAGLASWSVHPLSRALVEAAAPAVDQPTCVIAWRDVQEVAGQGLLGLDEAGREWRLGSRAWVCSGEQTSAAGADADGDTAAARVAFGPVGTVWACFDFEEQLRPGTQAAVQALLQAGLQVTLLTGDVPERANALAQRLGLLQVVASADPKAKLAAVAQAQALGQCVLMVGDGINDAPVLARADVSMAMGQGALVSRGQADAVITSNHLVDLVRARARAQKALAIVRQNMVWAVPTTRSASSWRCWAGCRPGPQAWALPAARSRWC